MANAHSEPGACERLFEGSGLPSAAYVYIYIYIYIHTHTYIHIQYHSDNSAALCDIVLWL